jgi:gamma-glutamyltranspeptidase/glutathione hydrolase
VALGEVGYEVRRWEGLHHFFGGVSAIGRAGAGADPRRDGAAALLPSEPAP